MNEEDISGLEGDALRFTFLRAAFPLVISEEPGNLASVLHGGEAVVFNNAMEFKVMGVAEQMVEAMLFLQSQTPSFEVTDNQGGVYCTIEGLQAYGRDFFEAGMRAFLLYVARRQKAQA